MNGIAVKRIKLDNLRMVAYFSFSRRNVNIPFQRGIAASPLVSDRWIVVVALGDILSNRSRGVLPRKFSALWPNPECEMETGRVPEAPSIAAIPVAWTFMSEILAM